MAARRGNIAIAALLLQHGAKVNAVDSRNATPLDAAKDWKRTEMVSFLEQHGAQ
jgi:ankyrin repeat protein